MTNNRMNHPRCGRSPDRATRNRRRALHRTTTLVLVAATVALTALWASAGLCEAKRGAPNVVIVLTDDQGFGELGATGNPFIRTPHIDRLAAQGVSLANFHVMPVCSPTRACLMTGRYNYRTGVTDTYLGRSLMHPDETTIAEMLAARRLPHRASSASGTSATTTRCGPWTRVSRSRSSSTAAAWRSRAIRPTRPTSAAPISTPRSATTARG